MTENTYITEAEFCARYLVSRRTAQPGARLARDRDGVASAPA